MDQDRFTLEEKLKIILEEAEKETGKKGLTGDEVIADFFPASEEDASSEEDLKDSDCTKLEWMINKEMQLSKGAFRLEPETFFKEDLTLNQFAKLIHEAEEADDGQAGFDKVEELTKEESANIDEEDESESDEDEELTPGLA